MFVLESYAAVRRFVFMERHSRREAAWVFGLIRETVVYSVPPGYVRVMPAEKPKRGTLMRGIEAILAADWAAPSKRIFERLRDEHGYGGGYTVVNDCVRRHAMPSCGRKSTSLAGILEDFRCLKSLSDFTYVPTCAGFVYVGFVIKTFADRIVGWRASRSAQMDFVLDALEHARYVRRPVRDGELIHHSDRGSQYVSIRYTERLREAGIEPLVGTVSDS